VFNYGPSIAKASVDYVKVGALTFNPSVIADTPTGSGNYPARFNAAGLVIPVLPNVPVEVKYTLSSTSNVCGYMIFEQ
ncbi:MAG TPA: hypothetical protein VGM23_13005, partial [Armatimonadota bacterium]